MLQWLKRLSAPASRPPTAEQRSVRQYRLTRKLGEGGMGVVFEARDDRLDRLVAIKRVRTMDTDPSLKERLLREARVAAKISHPNICQVYELAEENGELFVVMELLEGETLAGRIERGTVPLSEALQAALGILGALEALHSRGTSPEGGGMAKDVPRAPPLPDPGPARRVKTTPRLIVLPFRMLRPDSEI